MGEQTSQQRRVAKDFLALTSKPHKYLSESSLWESSRWWHGDSDFAKLTNSQGENCLMIPISVLRVTFCITFGRTSLVGMRRMTAEREVDPWGRTNSQDLKITEKWRKVLPLPCKRLDLLMARMTESEMAVPPPLGDVKTAPSINTFRQNTLPLI